MKGTTTRIENNGSGSDRESRRKPWPWPSTTSSSVPRSSRGVAGEEGPAGEKKTITFSIFLRPQSWAWARSSICNAWESNRPASAGESNGLRSFINRALFSFSIFQAPTGDDGGDGALQRGRRRRRRRVQVARPRQAAPARRSEGAGPASAEQSSTVEEPPGRHTSTRRRAHGGRRRGGARREQARAEGLASRGT